jgi:HEAT repeat protein
MNQLDPHKYNQEERQEAAAAIQAIGTNAIPFLIRELRGTVGTKRIAWLLGEYGRRQMRTEWAFRALGPEGKAGLPQLRLLLNGKDSEAAISAINIVSGLGSEGAWEVFRALTNRNAAVREHAAKKLYKHEDLPDAMPIRLVEALRSADKGVAFWLGHAIAKSRNQAGLILPDLTQNLTNENPGCRYGTLVALESYGATAERALPVITKHLEDPDDAVRKAAEDAIKAITKR